MYSSVHILIWKEIHICCYCYSVLLRPLTTSHKSWCTWCIIRRTASTLSVWMSDLFVDIDIWCLFWSVILIARESEASFGKSKHSQWIIKATGICLSLSRFMQGVSIYCPFTNSKLYTTGRIKEFKQPLFYNSSKPPAINRYFYEMVMWLYHLIQL